MKVLRAGLIGDHISQTRLPAALEIMCTEIGMELDFALIDTAHLSSFDFESTVDGLRAKGWTGVTVTHPYKTDAAGYANEGMQGDAERLGAANTLVFRKPLEGYNTDYTGFLDAWRMHQGNAGPGRVAMAGAGGVARALGPALAELGAEEIVLWDRDFAKAQDLADRIGPTARAIPLRDTANAVENATGLVNATPMGMREFPGTAFPSVWLEAQEWAFDAVYTPVDTQFLQDAENAGLRCFSGFDLFEHMALKSFEAYTQVTPDASEVLPQLGALRP